MIQTRLNRAAPADSQNFRQLREALEELAGLLGLTLVLYDQAGYLVGDCEPSSICAAIQGSEEGSRLCDRDCGGMLDQVLQGAEFTTFKCHASLYSFAAPIRVMGKVKFGVLGGRVFRSYADFSAFTQIAPTFGVKDYFFEDWDRSRKFENTDYFEKATRLIQSLVDAHLRGATQEISSKKRFDQVSTLYDLSTVLSLEDSAEKCFEIVLQAIGILFNIQGGAVFQAEGPTNFSNLTAFGSLAEAIREVHLGEHPRFADLSEGKSQILEDGYPILRMGYPETINRILSFPVSCRGRMAWVLEIFNTQLEAESVEVIQTFCRHLGVILENILLKQETHDSQGVLSVVNDFNLAIGSQLESQGLYRAIVVKTAELVGAEQASLMIFDETSQELAIKFVKGLNERIVRSLRVKPGEGLAGLAFETGRSILIKDVDTDPRSAERQRARYKTKSLICVPLKIDHRKIGIINLTDKAGGGQFDENDLRLVESVASHASLALDRTDYYKLTEDLRKISVTDSLTDLYNRRFFQERINEEIERSRRHGQPVSLIMLDIDNFKQYNDTYGHLAGDEALRVIAGVIRSSVRNIDCVARYGGEEFAVILPMTDVPAARDIAERIRTSIASRYFPDESLRAAVKLTASLGIASFPQHASNLFELVGNADKALYLAKINGKNRLAVFDSSQGNQTAATRSV